MTIPQQKWIVKSRSSCIGQNWRAIYSLFLYFCPYSQSHSYFLFHSLFYFLMPFGWEPFGWEPIGPQRKSPHQQISFFHLFHSFIQIRMLLRAKKIRIGKCPFFSGTILIGKNSLYPSILFFIHIQISNWCW